MDVTLRVRSLQSKVCKGEGAGEERHVRSIAGARGCAKTQREAPRDWGRRRTQGAAPRASPARDGGMVVSTPCALGVPAPSLRRYPPTEGVGGRPGPGSLSSSPTGEALLGPAAGSAGRALELGGPEAMGHEAAEPGQGCSGDPSQSWRAGRSGQGLLQLGRKTAPAWCPGSLLFLLLPGH